MRFRNPRALCTAILTTGLLTSLPWPAHAESTTPEPALEQAHRLIYAVSAFRAEAHTGDVHAVLYSQFELYVTAENATELLHHDPSLAARNVSDAAARIRAGIGSEPPRLEVADALLADVVAGRPTEHEPFIDRDPLHNCADPVALLDQSVHELERARLLPYDAAVVEAQARVLNAARATEQAFAHTGSERGHTVLNTVFSLRLALGRDDQEQLANVTDALDGLLTDETSNT